MNTFKPISNRAEKMDSGRQAGNLFETRCRLIGLRFRWGPYAAPTRLTKSSYLPVRERGMASTGRRVTVIGCRSALDTLFVTAGDKVFKRKLKVRGAPAFLPPVKPAPPRL